MHYLISNLLAAIVTSSSAYASGGGGGGTTSGLVATLIPSAQQLSPVGDYHYFSLDISSDSNANSSVSVTAQANGTSAHNGLNGSVTWKMAFGYPNSGYPTSVSVTYVLTDSSGQMWNIGGHNPPDPNGGLDAYSGAGASSGSIYVSQGVLVSSGTQTQSPGPMTTTTTLALTTWTFAGGGYFTDIPLPVLTTTSLLAFADYWAPANPGSADGAFSSAAEQCVVTSFS